jgi:hypothetical protein
MDVSTVSLYSFCFLQTGQLGEGEKVSEGRLTHDKRSGGGKVLLAQQTSRLGDKQEGKMFILLEFKRTSDQRESYFQDMWKVTENQHTPILTGLRTLTVDREWEVVVVPRIVGLSVVVIQTSCKDRNHPILREVIAPHQDFFF